MNITAHKSPLSEILPLRAQFLSENHFQIRYDAVHGRGWSDSWLLHLDGEVAGYGAVKGKEDLGDRDTIFEFFLLPAYRKWASQFFQILQKSTDARFVECQSNEPLMTSLLFEHGHDIRSEVVLFEDGDATQLQHPTAIFRPLVPGEAVFEHQLEPVGSHVLEIDGQIVATGGFLLHYNHPFADLYMEVEETQRCKGLGSFLLQEIKKNCYAAGRVPAARCNLQNTASKATLLKAGMRVCGFIMDGRLMQGE